jgi:hypothetical protein
MRAVCDLLGSTFCSVADLLARSSRACSIALSAKGGGVVKMSAQQAPVRAGVVVDSAGSATAAIEKQGGVWTCKAIKCLAEVGAVHGHSKQLFDAEDTVQC